MSQISMNDTELQRLRECCRIVEMIEVLCGEPGVAIWFHADDTSIPGHEHLIVVEGFRPAPEPCRGEDLESYDAEYRGRSLGACLEQAVAAKKARDE